MEIGALRSSSVNYKKSVRVPLTKIANERDLTQSLS